MPEEEKKPMYKARKNPYDPGKVGWTIFWFVMGAAVFLTLVKLTGNWPESATIPYQPPIVRTAEPTASPTPNPILLELESINEKLERMLKWTN